MQRLQPVTSANRDAGFSQIALIPNTTADDPQRLVSGK
jgi:hypothetical protein